MATLLCGCSTYPQTVTPARTNQQPSPEHQIFIVSHGWHTGIIVSARDVNLILPQLKTRFMQTQWYEIGWGDKDFYQAQEITTQLTLRAMFWSSGAVMHVVAFSNAPERYFSASDVQSRFINNSQYSGLMRYIGRSFARDDAGDLIPLKKGIYGDSQFYVANGRYGILNTCNKWTAKGMQSAGIAINPMLKLTAGSVMRAVQANTTCLNKTCFRMSQSPD